MSGGKMDLSVLPNNNHPDKFLQLDVKSLAKTSAFLQTWLANFPEAHFPGAQQWHNRVYSQMLLDSNFHQLWSAKPVVRDHGSCHPTPSGGPHFLHTNSRARKQVPFQREKKNACEQPVVQLSELHPAMIDKTLGKHITPVTLKSTIKSNPLYTDGFTDDSWEERKNNPSWTVQDYDQHSLNSGLAHFLKENPDDIQYWMEDIYTPGYDTLLKKKERERKCSRCCLIALLLVLLVCFMIATVTVCILFT